MEEELTKEFLSTAKMHILVYKFLLSFYKEQKVFDDTIYAQIKKYCAFLNSMDCYRESVVLRSTFNIGLLLGMFDRCASPVTQTLLNCLKKNLEKRMKRLKYLKNNIASYKAFTSSEMIKSKSLKDDAEKEVSVDIKNTQAMSNSERLKKIKDLYSFKYSEKAKAKYLEFKKENEIIEEQNGEKLGHRRKLKRRSWSKGIIKHKSKKMKKSHEKPLNHDGTGQSNLEKMASQDDFVNLCSDDDLIDSSDKPLSVRSIFSEYHTMDLDKQRNKSILTSMNEMWPELKCLNTNNRVLHKLCKKLHVTSTTHDLNLADIEEINAENVIQTYEDLQIETFYSSQHIPLNLITKPPTIIVGPLQGRLFDGYYIYSCTLEGCKNWHTTKPSLLHRHIQALHLEVKFNWTCSLCPCVDISFYKQTDFSDLECAFHHFTCKHLSLKKDADYLLEKYQTKNGSYIPDTSSIDESVDSKKMSGPPFNTAFSTAGAYNISKFNEVPKLFQCPVGSCSFTSDDEILSFQHFLNEFDGVEHFKCTYCDRWFKEVFAYCGHIIEEHGMDKYQCAYCCYRSISKSNVIHHQTDLHTANSVKILVGKDKAKLLSTFFDTQQSFVTIKPYKCIIKDCEMDTVILRFFLDHLASHKQHVTCQDCKFYTTMPSALIEHMPEHNYGEYQCKYCPYGTNNVQAIRRHMYQLHASRHPFCYQRAAFETEGDRISKHFTSISLAETCRENIILIDLDSSVAEELWDANLINVEEYEKAISTTFNFSSIEGETKEAGLIVISDSETEFEPNENVSNNPILPMKNTALYSKSCKVLESSSKITEKIQSKSTAICSRDSAAPSAYSTNSAKVSNCLKKNVAKKSTTRNSPSFM